MSKKKILLIFATLNLLLGLLVYFILDRNIMLFEHFNFSKSYYPLNYNPLRNYLSDVLYMFFICSICHFYLLIKIPKAYIIFFFLTPVLHEFLQFFFNSMGTFDVIDLIVYFLVSLIYYFLIYKYIEKKY